MSLVGIETSIWNEIAKTQPLATRWGKRMFRLNQEQQLAAEEREQQGLLDQGVPLLVAVAYSEMKPFLLERKAIALYLKKHPEWREAFPEITNVSEAVTLASMDHRLSPPQQHKLTALLQSALTT